MNASSVRDREREELRELAKLATESKGPKAPPPPTLSADSSGYVDLSALNLGNPNWIDEALRRTPRPPPPPARASAQKPPVPKAAASQAARDPFPSDLGVELFPRSLSALEFPEDDDMGLTARSLVAGRPKRLAPLVATVFVLCVVLCGFALRRVVLNRAAEADAARAVVSAGPVIPPAQPDIPPPPPVAEVQASLPAPTIAAAPIEAATPAAPTTKKPAAAHGAAKKKHAARAPATAAAKPAAAAKSAAAPTSAKTLDDAIYQSFTPTAKTRK